MLPNLSGLRLHDRPDDVVPTAVLSEAAKEWVDKVWRDKNYEAEHGPWRDVKQADNGVAYEKLRKVKSLIPANLKNTKEVQSAITKDKGKQNLEKSGVKVLGWNDADIPAVKNFPNFLLAYWFNQPGRTWWQVPRPLKEARQSWAWWAIAQGSTIPDFWTSPPTPPQFLWDETKADKAGWKQGQAYDWTDVTTYTEETDPNQRWGLYEQADYDAAGLPVPGSAAADPAAPYVPVSEEDDSNDGSAEASPPTPMPMPLPGEPGPSTLPPPLPPPQQAPEQAPEQPEDAAPAKKVVYYQPKVVLGVEYWPIPRQGGMRLASSAKGEPPGKSLFLRILKAKDTFYSQWKQPFVPGYAQFVPQTAVRERMEAPPGTGGDVTWNSPQILKLRMVCAEAIKYVLSFGTQTAVVQYAQSQASFNNTLRKAMMVDTFDQFVELNQKQGANGVFFLKRIHDLWTFMYKAPRLKEDLFVFRGVDSVKYTMVELYANKFGIQNPSEDDYKKMVGVGWLDTAFLSTTFNTFEGALQGGFHSHGGMLMCIRVKRGTPMFPIGLLPPNKQPFASEKEILLPPNVLYIFRGVKVWKTKSGYAKKVQCYDATFYDPVGSKKPPDPPAA